MQSHYLHGMYSTVQSQRHTRLQTSSRLHVSGTGCDINQIGEQRSSMKSISKITLANMEI